MRSMTRRAIRDVNNGYKVYSPYFWTEARVEHLRRLISDERRASEVGQLLGCTKNMVIGKCYREGITLPHSPTVWRAAPPSPKPFPESGCCLWGIGNPREPGFRFCGERNAPGNRNYCRIHAIKA